MLTDMRNGATVADTFTHALNKSEYKLIDLASNSLMNSLFGKQGSSGTGLLGSLFGSVLGGSGSSGGSGLPNLNFGFDTGGFTGSGGRLEPACIVHRGEFVFDQDSVRRLGVGTLEAMRAGRAGYDTGGYVGMTRQDAAVAQSGAANASSPSINLIDQRAAGSGDIEPTTQRRPDGGFDIIIRSVEGKLGQRASAGRGPFKQAAGGVAYRNG